jgi:hypothetical protein
LTRGGRPPDNHKPDQGKAPPSPPEAPPQAPDNAKSRPQGPAAEPDQAGSQEPRNHNVIPITFTELRSPAAHCTETVG